MNSLEEIKNQLLKMFEGENVNIYLYGSQARGTANFTSDVDVAIEYLSGYDASKIVDAQEFFADSTIPLTVNLVDLKNVSAEFADEVKSTGVVWKSSRLELAKKAVARLATLVGKNVLSDIERDSLIMRFQFSFELLWKCGKDFLEQEHGLFIASPKKVIRTFRELGYFTDNETADLLAAANDRNLTAHIYDEGKAVTIAVNIDNKYFRRLAKWLDILTQD